MLKCVGVEKYCDSSCELGANGWKIGKEQKGDVDASKRANKSDKRFDSEVNEYWYNAIWGAHKGEWICKADEEVSMSCKPQVNVKYALIKNDKQNGCVVFMPPCRNLEHFELPYKKNAFPGFQGFIPDAKYISFVLEKAFGKGKQSIGSIIEQVFGGKDSAVEALNFFLPLDKDVQSEFDIKQRVVDKHRNSIPADHKDIMRKNATLYYLYFNLLLQQKVVTSETKINESYCVRDALFYIVQDVWKLDLDLVLKSGNDFAADFDKMLRF